MNETVNKPQFELLEGHGFYLDVFPASTHGKVKQTDLIPIAARVRYTHLAAVVRWKKDYKLWRITEPKQEWYPPMHVEEPEHTFSLDVFERDFWSTPLDRINKNVVVWRQIGEAYVFGYTTRGIGESVRSSYTPSSYYGEADYEQGYFEAKFMAPLYALKSHLQGVDYFFAPIRCVEVI